MSQQIYPNKGEAPLPPYNVPAGYQAPQGAASQVLYAPPPYSAQGRPYHNVIVHGPGAPSATVYVQSTVQQAPPVQQKSKSGGMFGNFMKDVDKVGKQLGKGLDIAGKKLEKGMNDAGKKINDTVDKNHTSGLLDLFKNGNVVQMVSRSSGRTVQIVMSVTGLILDGSGPLDPNAFNSLFTVMNEGNNQIRLHNYNNYIAVIDGYSSVVTVTPGMMPGPETKFQLSQSGQFVSLESLNERKRRIGFIQTGEVKPALEHAKGEDGQFGIKLVSTAYPVMTS